MSSPENTAVIHASHPEAVRQTPADSSRYAQLNELLSRGYMGLRFQGALEGEFRLWHARNNAARFRSAVFYVLLLYLILGAGIMMVVPADALGLWPAGYSAMAVVILAGVILSRMTRLDPWHQQYVTVAAFLGMAVIVTIPQLSGGAEMALASKMGIIHACVVVGAMIGLRSIPAVIAMWGGGWTGILAQSLAGVQFDWLLVHQTLTAGCGVGTVLAWLMERNGRQVFLQQSLLALEKARSDDLAERMTEMSRHDGLTGLANRRYFDETLYREWQRCMRDGSSLSLMFIDVDYFKPFNDHYGHQEGDHCLAQLGGILKPHAKRPGDLAARYGGEEFVVLYPQTGPEGVKKLAEEVRHAVEVLAIPHSQSKTADHVTISVGTATVVPEESGSPEELVKAADHALYKAKDSGRNRVESAPMQSTA